MSTRSGYDASALWELQGENLSAHFDDIRHQLLPEVTVDSSVMRHLRTLQMSSVSDGEFIANLNVRELQPSHRDAPHKLSIDSLLLPDNSIRPTANRLIIPLISCLSNPSERRASASIHQKTKSKSASIFSMYDLSSTCHLSGREISLTLSVNLPVFQYTLHDLETSSTETPRLAEVSLTIVLSGGEPLITGQNFGFLLESPGRAYGPLTVEPIHLHDTSRGEDIVGVWSLGGVHYERMALAAFAAETETRRNVRLERRKGRRRSSRDEWTVRPAIVVKFSQLGESPRFSSGFLRIRVGSRQSFDAVLGYSHAGLSCPRRISAKFQNRVDLSDSGHSGAAAMLETTSVRRSSVGGEGLDEQDGGRFSMRSGVELMREIEEIGGNAGDDGGLVPRIGLSQLLQYDADNDVERLSGLGEWTPESEMDVLNEYCEKYLHVSYEDEMRREMEKLREE